MSTACWNCVHSWAETVLVPGSVDGDPRTTLGSDRYHPGEPLLSWCCSWLDSCCRLLGSHRWQGLRGSDGKLLPWQPAQWEEMPHRVVPSTGAWCLTASASSLLPGNWKSQHLHENRIQEEVRKLTLQIRTSKGNYATLILLQLYNLFTSGKTIASW